jgi:hypothetical protein
MAPSNAMKVLCFHLVQDRFLSHISELIFYNLSSNSLLLVCANKKESFNNEKTNK